MDELAQEKRDLISRDKYFAKLVEIGDMDISANLKLSCEMLLLCSEFIKNFTEEHGRYPEQQDFFNLVDSLIKNNS